MSRSPHVYVPGPWSSGSLEVAGEKAHHLAKVLRLDAGARLSYTDGQGTVGEGTLAAGAIERGDERPVARISDLTLLVAPPRDAKRMRFLVEKLAELGVARLVWLETERAVGRAPKADKAEAWAISGLEQSIGAWKLEIDTGSLADHPDAALADPGGEPSSGFATLAIGPEGGWTDSEREGRRLVGLGFGVLRVETAAIAAAFLSHSR